VGDGAAAAPAARAGRLLGLAAARRAARVPAPGPRRVALRPYDEAAVDAWLARRDDDALRRDLASAIESLPAHYREVLLLRDFEEQTIGEIAARVGDGPAAVKSRLHRARTLAREYLLS
jgi:RNA polymerase sigma factor (sigma-70 family)